MDRNLTRRDSLALAGGATVALAGCTGVFGGGESSAQDGTRLTVEVEGDGPGEQVTVTMRADDIETEETLSPGAEFQWDSSSSESLSIAVDYEDDLDVDVEWEHDDIEIEVELEQAMWERTTVESDFIIEDGDIRFTSDVAVELPESSTEATVTDERLDGEWEFELEVEVEDDGEQPEINFEVEDRS